MTERRRYPDSKTRIRSLVPLALAWLIGALVIGLVLLQDGVPVEDLFMDATYLGGRAWYIGMVSALGVVAWTVAVCGSLGAAWVAGMGQRPMAAIAFRSGGFLFALLLLDDLFNFHSALFPSVGVPKLVVIGAYGFLTLYWIGANVSEIRRTRWELLAAAGAAFAISVGVEAVWAGADAGLRVIIEDGSKFLGILALASWTLSSATDLVASVVSQTRKKSLSEVTTVGMQDLSSHVTGLVASEK